MEITFTEQYDQPIDAVWTALTDARAIRQWWVDTDFAPETGRTFFFQDVARGSWSGRVVGEVLDVDPPHRVLFRWTGGGMDTTVEYRLAETSAGGTEFTLTHRGLRGIGGLVIGTMLRSGWKGYVRDDVPAIAAHIATAGIDAPFPTPSKAARVAAGSKPGRG